MKVIVNAPEGIDPDMLLTMAYAKFLSERFKDLTPQEVMEAIKGLKDDAA